MKIVFATKTVKKKSNEEEKWKVTKIIVALHLWVTYRFDCSKITFYTLIANIIKNNKLKKLKMLLFRLNVHCNYDKLFCFKIIFSRCQGKEEAVHLQVIASLKRKKNQFSGLNTYYLPLLKM